MKGWKGCLAAVSLSLALGLAGCAGAPANTVTLWVGPVGDFAADATTGASAAADALAAAYQKAHPDTAVKTEALTAQEIDLRLAAGEAPDVLLDSTERILRNMTAGAAGNTAAIPPDDAQALWDENAAADFAAASAQIAPACQDGDGVYRIYPVAVMVDCIAANPTLFESAGAGAYLKEDRTWTTTDFRRALQALLDSGLYMPGLLYSGGTEGDQGTRLLLQNMANTPFTDAAHSRYTFAGDAATRALQDVLEMTRAGLLQYQNSATAADETMIFAGGGTAISLCWNATVQSANADSMAFTPYLMNYPCDDTPVLYGTVWGFATYNGSAAGQELARFAVQDAAQGAVTVKSTGQLPARSTLGNLYAGTKNEAVYTQLAALLPYMGDVYGVTPGWGPQRVAWRQLLEDAFTAENAEEAIATYETAAQP